MTPAEFKILSIPKVRERIVEAMGEWQIMDRWYSPLTGLSGYITSAMVIPKNHVSHIPLAMPMPGVDDKRTLVGMIRDFYRLSTYGDKWAVTCMGNPPPTFTAAPTPYLALLKALAAQWGVEVPND